MLLGMVTLYAFTFYFTQYLQLVEGLSPFVAGLWFIPLAVATTVAAMTAPVIARRFPPARVIAAGLVIAAGGFAALAFLDAGSGGLALLVAGGVVIGIGINPLLVLSTDLIVSTAPPERTGSAAAMQETSGELGAALGIALFGTLGTAVYSARMAGAVPGLPPGTAETAGDSFAGAFAIAQELPAAAGGALVAAAREAFLSGMNVVTAVSAAVLLAIAALVTAVLRDVRPLGGGDEAR
jgi:DHA2 family multidrug resistance protein-like MFS transporter